MSKVQDDINIGKILNRAYQRKRNSNPHYSQRALARDIGVTPAFVTNMLKGKKIPPLKRLNIIFKKLELDISERAYITKILVFKPEAISSKKYLDYTDDNKILKRKISLTNNRGFLSKWWNVAILEGLTLESPYNQPEFLKKSLGLTNQQWESAINCLKEEDLIYEEDGQYYKKDLHTYFPAGRPKKEFRDFHEQFILKAREELTTKISDEDFSRRLITGFTFAMNHSFTEQLKEKIMNFLDELSTEASQGTCQEIYQCNVQFYPLFKSTKLEHSS